METLIRAMKPIPLGLIFALLAVAAQIVFCSSRTGVFSGNFGSEPTYHTTYGLGSPIRISASGGKTDLSILWAVLIANLLTTYVFSNLAARELLKLVHLRRPAISYGLVIASMIGVTFLISISVSKAYWGYFFSPPRLLKEVNDIAAVQTVLAFRTLIHPSGDREIVADNDYSLASELESEHKYYSVGDGRSLLLALEQRQLLPHELANSYTGLPELYPLILKSGVLVASTKGYDSSSQLYGKLVAATNSKGNGLLLLSFSGGQVSNDHYPYYDMVFRAPEGSANYSLVRSQHYYYDAAGLEGFEWPVIWMLISIPGILLGIVVFSILRAILPRSRPKYAGASPDLDYRG